MPDLDPLPPPPRRPVLAPRPGDFDDMTRRVARRRYARYGAAGGAVATAATVAFVLGGGTTGISRIDAVPGATPGVRTSPTASPTPTPTGSATPSPVGEPSPGPGDPTVAPSGGRPPAPTATAAPSPTATPPPPQPPRTAHASLVREDVPYRTGSCGAGGTDSPGWCVRQPSARVVQSGEPSEHVAAACRLPGTGTGTLTFHSRDEIGIRVYDDNSVERYAWGKATFRETHAVDVGAGRCAQWTWTYDATDSAGRPLEPGSYSASFNVDAWFSGPRSAATTYTFSLTVVE